MFFQHIRSFPRHNIPENTSADTSDHPQKDYQEMIIAIPRFHTRIDPNYRKRPQTYGIQNIHYSFITLHIPASQKRRPEPEKHEKHQHSKKSSQHIYRIAEHIRRYIPYQNIPEHTSAHSSDDTQYNNPEQIQLFTDSHHRP